MAKPTQAHMSRRVSKSRPGGLSQMTRTQIEYYMGAKLIEVGVNPKSAIYRWTSAVKGNDIEWTYSAYWGDSKDKLLGEEGY